MSLSTMATQSTETELVCVAFNKPTNIQPSLLMYSFIYSVCQMNGFEKISTKKSYPDFIKIPFTDKLLFC